MRVPPLRGVDGRNVAPCRSLHEIMCDRLPHQETAVTNSCLVPPPPYDLRSVSYGFGGQTSVVVVSSAAALWGKSCHTALPKRDGASPPRWPAPVRVRSLHGDPGAPHRDAALDHADGSGKD